MNYEFCLEMYTVYIFFGKFSCQLENKYFYKKSTDFYYYLPYDWAEYWSDTKESQKESMEMDARDL